MLQYIKDLPLLHKFILGAVVLTVLGISSTFILNGISNVNAWWFDRKISSSNEKIAEIQKKNDELLTSNKILEGQNIELKKERLILDQELKILKDKAKVSEAQIQRESEKLEQNIDKIEKDGNFVNGANSNYELCLRLNSIYKHNLSCEEYK